MNILNKLTIKHLKMNKKRTIVSIIGIILSTALMVGIGLLMSTMRENMIDMVKINTGDWHTTFYHLTEKELKEIKANKEIKDLSVIETLGHAKYEHDLYEIHYIKVLSTDSKFLNKINLKEGKIPTNKQEIIIPKELENDYPIGSTITLEIGTRFLETELKDDELLENENNVQLINTKVKTYTVVGIIENNIYQDYNDVGVYAYTTNSSDIVKDYTVYAYFSKITNTRNHTNQIKEDLSLNSDQIKINESLLELYGSSRYNNFMGAIINSLLVILIIVSIACIIVIYNSFAISVMERKKQFGLLSSIGTTKKQIRHTVFFEAFAVGIIGIPLGLLSSYLGIGCVLMIINNLLPNLFGNGMSLKLVTYPIFIIIPLIFMVATILISAFLPARSASRITPIEAIRLNDDIKIKGKKVRTPKWIRKLFGMEGEIALKNMKRNKKKYRITILSLFISIVLFVSFSGYMKYMFMGVDSFVGLPEFDIAITISSYQNTMNDPSIRNFKNDVIKNKDIKQSLNYNQYSLTSTTDLSNKKYYTDKFYEFSKNYIEASKNGPLVTILEIDESSYQDLLKEMGKKDTKPILYNYYETIQYENNTRKSYMITRYSSRFDVSIDLCENIYEEEKTEKDCKYTIDDYYVSDLSFYGKSLISNNEWSIIFIVPMNYFGDLSEFNNGMESGILVNIDNDDHFKEEVEDLSNKYSVSSYYQNIKEEYQLTRNLVFCIKLLVYGFITLVTLIGVTSVFNTINTSIHLRRKEFAMLRSMGLSNRGFNKILLFESLFFGLKSLLYALPVSFGIIYLLHLSFENMTDFNGILVPYNEILLAVLGVFIIIIISTIYATRKIRHENILEAIREENI